MINSDLVAHLHDMMSKLKTHVSESAYSGEETGHTNTKEEKSIVMDVSLERILVEYVQEYIPGSDIFSEECGWILSDSRDLQYLVVFDPLDGSINYKYGKGMLPFGTFIAIYSRDATRTTYLGQVLAACLIEYTQGNIFIFDGEKTIDGDGGQVHIQDWKIDKKTPVYFDLYYGCDDYKVASEKFFLRGSGSQAGNLSFLLSGVCAMVGGPKVAPEEIGAFYALTIGAGGVVVNHKREQLATHVFSTDTKYDVFAGDTAVVSSLFEE